MFATYLAQGRDCSGPGGFAQHDMEHFRRLIAFCLAVKKPPPECFAECTGDGSDDGGEKIISREELRRRSAALRAAARAVPLAGSAPSVPPPGPSGPSGPPGRQGSTQRRRAPATAAGAGAKLRHRNAKRRRKTIQDSDSDSEGDKKMPGATSAAGPSATAPGAPLLEQLALVASAFNDEHLSVFMSQRKWIQYKLRTNLVRRRLDKDDLCKLVDGGILELEDGMAATREAAKLGILMFPSEATALRKRIERNEAGYAYLKDRGYHQMQRANQAPVPKVQAAPTEISDAVPPVPTDGTREAPGAPPAPFAGTVAPVCLLSPTPERSAAAVQTTPSIARVLFSSTPKQTREAVVQTTPSLNTRRRRRRQQRPAPAKGSKVASAAPSSSSAMSLESGAALADEGAMAAANVLLAAGAAADASAAAGSVSGRRKASDGSAGRCISLSNGIVCGQPTFSRASRECRACYDRRRYTARKARIKAKRAAGAGAEKPFSCSNCHRGFHSHQAAYGHIGAASRGRGDDSACSNASVVEAAAPPAKCRKTKK